MAAVSSCYKDDSIILFDNLVKTKPLHCWIFKKKKAFTTVSRHTKQVPLTSYYLVHEAEVTERKRDKLFNGAIHFLPTCTPHMIKLHISQFDPPTVKWKSAMQVSTIHHAHIRSIIALTHEHIIDCKKRTISFTCIFRLDLQRWWSENSWMKMNGKKQSSMCMTGWFNMSVIC